MEKVTKLKKYLVILLSILMVLTCACSTLDEGGSIDYGDTYIDLESIPEYSGHKYVILNDNIPEFTEEDLQQDAFEYYSELDKYGRCGVAYAMLGRELMPTGPRESISDIKPTGWKTAPYEDLITDVYLYNRSHLIAHSLAGENANPQNLITGTDYMNKQGMLPFEEDVLWYIRNTGNHVMYRVTPVFHDDELVARGVQMEAYSVEDDGEEICFNVYIYNVQPGVEIDYETGENWRDADYYEDDEAVGMYILNTSSMKFHYDGCDGAYNMNSNNRKVYEGPRSVLINQGYEPCGNCRP
ncbi:MAG: DNA/RNA non-specific endonuclease [Firmicutes bacterium]|nr:DNA/RNA non-specific endonuclease [Bacillota bacterium]